MVVRHRAALTEANMVLKGHFTKAIGGANALDSYITKVANRYGAGADNLSCDSLQSIALAAMAEESSLKALVAIANRAEVSPVLPEGACVAPLQIAALK
jgi:hypothetical protein